MPHAVHSDDTTSEGDPETFNNGADDVPATPHSVHSDDTTSVENPETFINGADGADDMSATPHSAPSDDDTTAGNTVRVINGEGPAASQLSPFHDISPSVRDNWSEWATYRDAMTGIAGNYFEILQGTIDNVQELYEYVRTADDWGALRAEIGGLAEQLSSLMEGIYRRDEGFRQQYRNAFEAWFTVATDPGSLPG